MEKQRGRRASETGTNSPAAAPRVFGGGRSEERGGNSFSPHPFFFPPRSEPITESGAPPQSGGAERAFPKSAVFAKIGSSGVV